MTQLMHDKDILVIYGQIRDVLSRARVRALRSVNFEMVVSYWEIGRLIFEGEQRGKERAGYGDYLIRACSILKCYSNTISYKGRQQKLTQKKCSYMGFGG